MRFSPQHLADALGHDVSDKRLDILRRIGEKGSISEAARGAGLSYKAAWQAIDTLSNLAGAPLLERTVGGAGGGGARLSAAGTQLLQAADVLHKARTAVLAQLAAQHTHAATPPMQWAALGLRTSMRNQLPCTIQTLKSQGQAVQVTLVLGDGTALFTRITQESVELLGLHPGQAVLALCKATAVTVARARVLNAADATNTPPHNHLPGRVTRASRAAAGGEVSVELACGLRLVGFAAAGSGLRVGSAAVAHVDASAVVVALVV